MGSSAIFGGDSLTQLLQTGHVTSDGQELTSGRRSRNFIRNRSGYRNTNGWSNNTATVTRTTTSGEIVDGVASLKFSGGTTSSHYVSDAFTINNIQKGLPLNISFDFITQSGAAGDWEVGIFDVTAAAYIVVSAPALNSLGNLPAGNGTFNAFFIASTNTSYELRIIRRAGAGTFSAANFDIFQQQSRVGAGITDWQPYTPTLAGITLSTSSLFWKRSGSDLIVQGFIDLSAVSAATAKVSIPSGITINTTVIPVAQKNIVGSAIRSTGAGGANLFGAAALAVIVTPSDTSNVNFSYLNTTDASGNVTSAPVLGNDPFSATTQFSINFTVPINEWSSNTQMADRALEEFAYNTNTANGGDTTSFGYGAAGSLIPNITQSLAATNQTYRVRFQSPIQATDKLEIEIQDTVWIPLAAYASQVSPFNYNGGNYVGMQINRVVGSTTDVDIKFGTAGGVNTGAYASGTAGNYITWATLNSTGIRYRVRKVSAGAQIGGAIASTNIVSDGQGIAIPTGYLGEQIRAVRASSAASSVATATAINIQSITLTPGVWDINAVVGIAGTLTGTQAIGWVSNVSATLPAAATSLGDSRVQTPTMPTTASDISLTIPQYRVIVTAATEIWYVGAYIAYTVGSASVYGRISAVRVR
jgi:hypothetical protein